MRRLAWKHPLFALVLPAVLIGIGVWQLTRVDGQVAEFNGRASRVEASMERLRPLATRDPNASVTFRSSAGVAGDTMTAQAGMTRLGDAATDLRRDAEVEQARVVAAWVAIGGGAVALLAGLAGLAATSAGALRGRRDRQKLVGAFRGVVRVLPPLLGAVTVATAVSVVAAVLFEVGGAWFYEDVSTGEVKLILVGLMLAAGMVIYAFGSVRQLRRALDAFAPQPMSVLGRAVSPTDAPGLWNFVRTLADRQGAGAPDNIVVGLTQGFFVTSSQVLITPEQRLLTGKSLYMPATYVPLLSEGETSAIIAHELAHFTGEDTHYSLHFLPLYASMSRSMAAVTERRGTARRRSFADGLFQPAAILAAHVLDTFDRVVNHWSRLREFEADRASLRAGDSRHAATALLRTGMGAGLINGALDDIFRRPADADRDVVGAVVARAGAVGFTDPARHLEDRQPHPTDTHPPTRQRIEALDVPIDDSLLAEASRPMRPDDDAFASGLFHDWRALRHQLGEDLLGVARARDQAFQADLTAAAAAVTADIAIHERGVIAVVVILSVVACVFLAIGLGAAAGTAFGWDGFTADGFVIGAAVTMTAIGALFLWMGAARYRRGRAGPFLVVGPAGFRCAGLAGEVPWSAVRGVRVTVGQKFITAFHLEEGAAMPKQTGRKWTVKLDRRKRVLSLTGYAPRGMKPQAYLDLLNSALRAYRARAILREREAESAAKPT